MSGQVSHSARENRLMNASPIVASNNQKFSVLPDPGKGFCTLKACSSAVSFKFPFSWFIIMQMLGLF